MKLGWKRAQCEPVIAIVVALIVAATGFGVWAATKTAHHEDPHDEDLNHGSPVGGGLFVMPPVY